MTIVIDGEEFEIPSNAGIDTDTCPSAMHMTHTHDNTGKLHVENYTIEEVPLEVFFDVWGMHFDETGIFNHRGGSFTYDGKNFYPNKREMVAAYSEAEKYADILKVLEIDKRNR